MMVISVFLMIAGSPAGQGKETTGSGGENTGLILLNEISPFDGSGNGSAVWFELINAGDTIVSLDGWSLRSLSGWTMDLRGADGACPPGGIILVLTGSQAIPSDVPGDTLIIEGGQAPGFDADGDGCMLVGPGSSVDAITWGFSPDTSGLQVPAGEPLNPERGFYSDDESIHDPGDVLIRLPMELTGAAENPVGSGNWAYRSMDEGTPGRPNPLPMPVNYMPSDGSEIASDFYLYVTGYEWSGYTTFQLSRDPGFSAVDIENTIEGDSLLVEAIEPGTWYWRVRGYIEYPDSPGEWSSVHDFVREPFEIDDLIAAEENKGRDGTKASGGTGGNINITASHTVATVQMCQRKDSGMLCLDGCNMEGSCSWCSEHPNDLSCRHGDSYCTRCSVAMMASAGGQLLSQDRITYYLFEEAGTASSAAVNTNHINDPYGDLGHSTGTWSVDCPLMVSWLYGQPKSASQEVFYHDDIFYDDSPEMDSFVEFIMDGRTILRHCPWHTTLLTGVATVNVNGVEKYYVRVHDTAPPGNVQWFSLESTKAVFNEYTFPPTTGEIIRSDEAEFSMDSDGDGLTDFDETRRFHTDPNDQDTDSDGVADRDDIVGYMFDLNGDYSPHDRDIDGDGMPKERDPDNDDPNNSSINDGCEDADQDGLYNMFERETDCFVAGDDFDYVNPDCFRGYLKIQVLFDIDIPMDNFDFLNDSVEMILIEDGPLDSPDYCHSHTWSRLLDANDMTHGGRYFADGSSTLSGNAMVIIEQDQSTGEYYATTDVDTEAEDFEWTNQFPMAGGMSMGWNPTIFFFKSSPMTEPRFELGEPEEYNGGLVLRGEREFYDEAGIQTSMASVTYSWEIWITPPSS